MEIHQSAIRFVHVHSVLQLQSWRGRFPFGVTPMGRMQNFVWHNYHGHSDAVPLESEREPSLLGESSISPVKLHNLLEEFHFSSRGGDLERVCKVSPPRFPSKLCYPTLLLAWMSSSSHVAKLLGQRINTMITTRMVRSFLQLSQQMLIVYIKEGL
jgi:hypothetical protein